jgi:hypothetical protein
MNKDNWEKAGEGMPGGWIDWNKLTLDDYCDFLENKYQVSSTGEAKAIFELIKFYKNNKNNNESKNNK